MNCNRCGGNTVRSVICGVPFSICTTCGAYKQCESMPQEEREDTIMIKTEIKKHTKFREIHDKIVGVVTRYNKDQVVLRREIRKTKRKYQ